MVPLAATVAGWATRDLSLRSPLQVKWFMRRNQIPDLNPPPGESGRTLTEEEWFNMCFNMNASAHMGGLFRSCTLDVVYILVRRCPYQMVLALLHEARHAWQHQHRKFTRETRHEEAWRPKAEADAIAYEHRVAPTVFPLVNLHTPSSSQIPATVLIHLLEMKRPRVSVT
jgi:hypothetical protein